MNTQKWLNAIDKNTERFLSTFGDLTEEQLNWKPDEQSWSIGQNIDHLIKINQSYYPLIESIHKGTYKVPITGKVGVLTKLFGRILLKSVQPQRNKKMKTFQMWEPANSNIKPDILNRFKSHHEDLKETISKSEPLLEQGVVISSPASRYIVYKLETAYDIIVTHEQRHYEQAKEVLNSLPAAVN